MDSALLALAFLVIAAGYGAAAFHYGAWCQRRFEDTAPIRRRMRATSDEMDELLEQAKERAAARRASESTDHPAGPPPPMPGRERKKPWTTPSIS